MRTQGRVGHSSARLIIEWSRVQITAEPPFIFLYPTAIFLLLRIVTTREFIISLTTIKFIYELPSKRIRHFWMEGIYYEKKDGGWPTIGSTV